MQNRKKLACIGIRFGRNEPAGGPGEPCAEKFWIAPESPRRNWVRKRFLGNLWPTVGSFGDGGRPAGLEPVAVGLGVAGKIDAKEGSVVFSPNLPRLDGYPLGRRLAESLQIPVYMENDANVFGLGESFTGAARGFPNWVGIVLGTGTGGCLFLNGKLWEGEGLGFSGEIGHMIVEPGGPACPCGSKGCLEAFASARALVSGARRRLCVPGTGTGPG